MCKNRLVKPRMPCGDFSFVLYVVSYLELILLALIFERNYDLPEKSKLFESCLDVLQFCFVLPFFQIYFSFCCDKFSSGSWFKFFFLIATSLKFLSFDSLVCESFFELANQNAEIVD